MTTRTPPLAGADLWQAVMAAAAGRCQCRGACGKNHAKTGGRCNREHGGFARHSGGSKVHLIAAPAEPSDLLLPDHQAAALPKQRLAAWCSTCHHAAHANARRTAHTTSPTGEPDTLFAL